MSDLAFRGSVLPAVCLLGPLLLFSLGCDAEPNVTPARDLAPGAAPARPATAAAEAAPTGRDDGAHVPGSGPKASNTESVRSTIATAALLRSLAGEASPAEEARLRELGPALVARVESQLAGKPFGSEHIRASGLLGALPAQADPDLARLARSDDTGLRRVALAALIERPDRPAVLATLRACLHDPDPKLRILAHGSLAAREQRQRQTPEELENDVTPGSSSESSPHVK